MLTYIQLNTLDSLLRTSEIALGGKASILKPQG